MFYWRRYLGFSRCNNSFRAYINWVKAISVHSIKKKFPFFQFIYYITTQKKLNTRKTMLTSISSIAFVTYWISTGLRNVWLLTLNTIFYLHNHTLKFNISITQSYFKVPKDVRLNSTYLFIMRIPNKREFQQIALNNSSDLDFKYFINTYKKCTAEPHFFWLMIQLYHQIIL